MQPTTQRQLISIVTPCFNEELNIPVQFERVNAAISSFQANYDFEFIFTDNNSTDGTFATLKGLAAAHRNVRVLRFSRNIGPNRAVYMGLCHAQGDATVLIQADLQDPPELIPDLIRGWEEGYDVVYGQLTNREEGFVMKQLRKFYYSFIAQLADTAPPLNAGEFRITSKRVLDAIKQYKEDDIYLRGIVTHIGFPQKAVPYVRAKRLHGRSNVSFLFLISYGLNGLISTATVAPIRAVIILGILTSFLGFFMGAYTVVSKLLWPAAIPHGITMIIALVAFFAGVQLFALGIIGEYIRKIYVQSLRRPIGFIRDKINFYEPNT